jgi:hypothetical protein
LSQKLTLLGNGEFNHSIIILKNPIYSLQYYEKLGKPTPKIEVMKFLKGKGFTDAQDFAGECESVVILAKGQSKCPCLSSIWLT